MTDNKYPLQTGKKIACMLCGSLNIFLVLGVISVMVVLSVMSSGEPGWDLSVLWLLLSFAVGLFFLIAVGGTLITVLYFRSLTYEIDDDEFVLRKGILGRSEKILPYGRIQHITIAQDFWERIFGIANVNVETADPNDVVTEKGGQVVFVGPQIPALLLKDANKVKDFIVAKLDKTKGTGLISHQ